MARKLFINLAVKDLNKTVAFWRELGFEFDARMTNESATCMLVNDGVSVMLLVESFFQGFTKKAIADTSKHTEAILALTAENRAAVDAFADRALALGATPANEPQDHGFMYGRSFHDPDGHLWEILYADESQFA